MDQTVVIAIIGLACTIVGWYAKVLIAAMTPKPAPAWNGAERRSEIVETVKVLIRAEIAEHRATCSGLQQLAEQLAARLDSIDQSLKGLQDQSNRHLEMHAEHK